MKFGDTYNGPLTTHVSVNRYTYANANPIRYSDPTGHCAEEGISAYVPSCADAGVSADVFDSRTTEYFADPEGIVPAPSEPDSYTDWEVFNEFGALGGMSALPAVNIPSLALIDQQIDCVATLSCKMRDFDAMTISDRSDWLTYVTTEFASEDNAKDWFNNVAGVLRFFDTKNLAQTGTWASIVDANIPQGIQNGLAIRQGIEPAEYNAASDDWAAFFTAAEDAGPNQLNDKQTESLRHLWGTAEQVATDDGLILAKHRFGLTPSAKEQFLFIEVGNFYRGALIDPSTADGVVGRLTALQCGDDAMCYVRTDDHIREMLLNDFDPRNPSATYDSAMLVWRLPTKAHSILKVFL